MTFYPTNQALVVFELESTRGVDQTPVESGVIQAGAGVVYVTTPAIPTTEFDSASSERLSAARNARPSGLKTGLTSTITIETELTGSGDAGVDPDPAPPASWTKILAAFNMAEDATTGVISPDSTADNTITIYSYVGGLLYKLTNCVGTNWTISGEGGQIIKQTFEFTGVYHDPVEEAIPSHTYADSQPIVLADAALQVGDLVPADICAGSFTFALNGEASVRKCINVSGAIKDVTPGKRAPTIELVTAAFGPDDNVVTVGTVNIYEAMQAGTLLPFTITLGTGTFAGTKYVLAGNIEVNALPGADNDGVLGFSSLSGAFVSDTDDGDFTLTYS